MGSHMETDALVHYKSTYAEANQLESKVNHQNKQRKLNIFPPPAYAEPKPTRKTKETKKLLLGVCRNEPIRNRGKLKTLLGSCRSKTQLLRKKVNATGTNRLTFTVRYKNKQTKHFTSNQLPLQAPSTPLLRIQL